MTILFVAKDATTRIWYRLMDAIDPQITAQIRGYAGEDRRVQRVASVRARWVGHELQADVVLDTAAGADTVALTRSVRDVLLRHVRYLTSVTIEIDAPLAVGSDPTAKPATRRATDILPPRYQDPSVAVSAAPMGAVDLHYDRDGQVAWDEMWGGFCELALAGGAPHRGTLLEPVAEAEIAADPERYAWVLDELEKGIAKVTQLPVIRSPVVGWIGMECLDEEMALWMLRAIVVENVTVRREGRVLWFPAGPDFRLEGEVKNIVTVVAKTNHYWQEHLASQAAAS